MTPEEIVNENFQGLDELIDDKDLLSFYKDLIVTCLEEYGNHMENLPKQKQEPIGYVYKTSDGLTEFVSIEDYKFYISQGTDTKFTTVYTHPIEAKEETINLELELNAFANHVLLGRKLNNSNEIAELVTNYLKNR
jgi:hypothetical protein